MFSPHFAAVFLTVGDLRAKVTFSEQTKTPLIRPNYGRWRWSPENPKPSWNAIKSAPVWKDPMYSSIRTALSKPPATVTPSSTGDQALKQLLFQLPAQPGATRTLTVYEAAEGSVPPAMLSVVPRAAVVLLDGTDLLAKQIQVNIDKMAVMMFGTVPLCNRMRAIIQHNCPNVIVHSLWVYVKPRQADPRSHNKLADHNILLVGDEANLKFQVFTHCTLWQMDGNILVYITSGHHRSGFPLLVFLCATSHKMDSSHKNWHLPVSSDFH